MGGLGREFGHSRVTKESSATPTISFDDAFLSDGEEVETQEAFEAAGDPDSAVKLLVVRDDKSKAIFGHVVPKKGIDKNIFAFDSFDSEPTIVKLLS